MIRKATLIVVLLFCSPQMCWSQHTNSYAANEMISKHNLGLDSYTNGRYESSISMFIKMQEIFKTLSLYEQSQNYTALSNAAQCLKMMEQYDKAIEFHNQILFILEEYKLTKSADYAKELSGLGYAFLRKKDFKQSSEKFKAAEKIYLKLKTPDKEGYATVLQGFGSLEYVHNRNEEAIKYYGQAVQLIGSSNPINEFNYASALENYALMHDLTGKYEEAELYYRQAVSILEKYPDEKVSLATALSSLAGMYAVLGNFSEAQKNCDKALEIQKTYLGETSEGYLGTLNIQGMIYGASKNVPEMEKTYLQLIQLRRKKSDYYNLSIVLGNFAQFLTNSGKYDEAIVYAKESLDVGEKHFGGQMLNPGADYVLGISFGQRGQYEQALYHLNKTKAFYQKQNQEYLNVSAIIALTYNAMGRKDLSKSIWMEISYLFNESLKKSKLYMSDREIRLNMASKDLMSSLLNYGCIQADNDEITSVQYNTIISIKNMRLQNFLALKNGLAKSNPQTQKKFSEYVNMKIAIAKEEQVSPSQQINDELTTKSNTAEKELMQLSPEFRKMINENILSWKSIQQSLSPEDVIIDIVDYDEGYTEGSQYRQYAAYILRKDMAAPKLIRLCSQKALDDLLKLNYAVYKIKDDTGNTNKALYNIAWKPLLAYLNNTKTIYIIPGGGFNTINFNAIVTPDGKHLVDQYTIRFFNNSSRIIDAKKESKILPSDSAMIFGGINYDVFPDKTNTLKNNSLKNTSFTSATGQFNPLKGAATEMEAIKDVLLKFGYKVESYTSEEEYKTIGQSKTTPFILHFATHGFTLNKKPETTNSIVHISDFRSTFAYAENPLLRTGLALAGANEVWAKGITFEGREDGVLTAQEIANTNLQGCKLAVLSACETGLGEINSYEGVYGLQRAFKMAGVEKVLLTLWSIDDKATTDFMQYFYNELILNKGISDAFKKAMIQFKRDYKDPKFWAPFILTE